MIKESYFDTFEAAATAFEKIRGALGHGATLKYACLPVPPSHWEYAGALEHAMALYDHDHPDYPCGAVPVYEGDGVFVHETCTGNTTFTLRPAAPYGDGWIVEVKRSQDAAPIGGGWNEEIAEALGIDWGAGPWNNASWERAQEEWEAEQPAGYAAGHDVEITRVERPTEGGQ